MHKRFSEFFIIDILVAIDKIKRIVSNLKFDDFISNEYYVDAVLRNFEIIGEASGQLLRKSDFLKEVNVEWRKIIDFRNILIHFYFGINLKEVFRISLEEVPKLEKNILDFIKKKDDRSIFLRVIKGAKTDLAKLYRNESIKYLEKIEKIIS